MYHIIRAVSVRFLGSYCQKAHVRLPSSLYTFCPILDHLSWGLQESEKYTRIMLGLDLHWCKPCDALIVEAHQDRRRKGLTEIQWLRHSIVLCILSSAATSSMLSWWRVRKRWARQCTWLLSHSRQHRCTAKWRWANLTLNQFIASYINHGHAEMWFLSALPLHAEFDRIELQWSWGLLYRQSSIWAFALLDYRAEEKKLHSLQIMLVWLLSKQPGITGRTYVLLRLGLWRMLRWPWSLSRYYQTYSIQLWLWVDVRGQAMLPLMQSSISIQILKQHIL